ncbi:MAG: sodium:proton antiporter [Hyphomicrobiales bacterium]|nr:sodium:proton antiporter [Hyphomicrobiales bacterium]
MLDLTGHTAGILALILFLIAYGLVIFEELIHMRKSKPVMLAAGLIWACLAFAYMGTGKEDALNAAAKHTILEYGELFLFLMVAITYVNSLEERRVFDALRAKLVGMGLSYRKLFWLTGILSFFLSPLLDNLTTSLIMGAVVMAVGSNSKKFVVLACINVVVAANAGGAFSPFGDITTLMVWQKGKIEFTGFFIIFVPSVVNYIIPAMIMNFAVPRETPEPVIEHPKLKSGAKIVIFLFAATIVTAISFKNFFHLPPAMGMMLGLGYLMVFSFFLKKHHHRRNQPDMLMDAFKEIERVEWDTLLFFFGIIFAVGGLGVIGYLETMSQVLYVGLGDTSANVIIGALSAIVDNIPLMFAVLTMDPDMVRGQWLLITLTAGVGGSLLSIGSAAGVALMGTARGYYTFMSHLKWTWAIALGYAASVLCHLWLNASTF